MSTHGILPISPLAVIVADDDVDHCSMVAQLLRADGHAVVEAHDGTRLLELLEETVDDPRTRSDVVVTDVMMPGLSGLGVLEALRSANLRVPVILMTALNDPSVSTVGRRLGAVGVLHKPFDEADLRTAVINAVAAFARPPGGRLA